MASDAQYVPILPSFKGFFKEVGKGAEKGGSQAGKTFADSMAREVKKSESAVEKATVQVERARNRQATAADKTRVASAKLTEVMGKENAKASELVKARADLEKAQRDEEATKKASERASRKLEKAEADLKTKTQEAEDATGDFAQAQESAESSSGSLSAGLDKTKMAFLAVSGAISAAVGALYGVGSKFDEAWDTIRVGTGASGEALEGLKDTARNVASSVPSSIEEVGAAVADVNTRLGLTGEPLEKFSSQLLELENMGVDADINAISQAISGFGIEAEHAPDALDELFQISQATGKSVTELSNSAVKAGPALREFGFDLSDTASLAGQLDKAGLDADKTMQTMHRALSSFAAEGRDAPQALQETINQIDELVQTGNSTEAVNLASNIFGTRGAAQFVDAVKSGTLSVEDFMGATGATEDTILGVAEETRSASEEWQLFKNQALLAIEPIAIKLFDLLGPALETASGKLQELSSWVNESLIPAFQSFVDWLQRSAGAIASVAAPLGVLAGAFGLLAAQQKIAMAGGFIKWMTQLNAVTKAQTAITKGAAAAQAAMNLVMNANPIFLVVTAIAALVAGLVVFFTKTETGRELWAKFTDAVKAGWEAVTTKFREGWDNIIQPVWQAITDFATETLWPILQDIFTWIGDKWQWLSDKFSEGWGWIRDNVLRPMVDFFQNTLWPAIQDVLGWIGDKWQWLSDTLSTIVNWIYDNVIMFYVDALKMLWDNVQQVISWIADKWQWMADRLSDVWNWIYQNVILRAIDGYKTLWNHVLDVINWIGDKWDWMGEQLHRVWNWIDQNVFSPLKSGLDTVQEWFRKGVDGISRVWDGLRAAAAKPVKFVVGTVWNDGLLRAWNAIAGFLPGIDKVDKIDLGELGGYAQGGVTPGYTPGRDVHDFYSPTGGVIHLSGGEAIMRPEWTRAVGGKKAVDRMNRLARSGRLDEEQMAIGLEHGTLGAFANGGVIGAMSNIVKAKYPMLTLTSGYRPGGGGYHGAGLASDWSNGGGNTPQQLALAHDIARTYPGSAELIYDSPGWSGNLKDGRNVGPFGSFYTMAQAGPHHHHVHWAMTTPPNIQFGGGVFEGGNNGGDGGLIGGFFNWIADKAKGIWSEMVDPLKGKIEKKREDSKFWDIPFGFLESVKEKAWSFLSSKFGSGGGQSSGAVDTSDVSGAVVDQVETVFARHGFTGAEWEAAKWIIGKESGWNPTATNPSSGAYGLFQFNPMGGNTLAGYLPDRNPNPAVQADAGARYIKDRYGSPTAAKAFWEQNGWYADGGVIGNPKLYDQGGWIPHGGLALNLSGKPEPVLTDAHWNQIAELIRSVGELIPALKHQTDVIADNLAPAVNEFTRAFGGDVLSPRPHMDRLMGVDNARAAAFMAGWAGTAQLSEIMETFSKLPLLGDVLSPFKGIVTGMESINAAYSKHGESLADVKEKEAALAAAHKELAEAREKEEGQAEAIQAAQEKVAEAELDLSDARDVAVATAAAAGQAHIALAIEVANVVFNIIQKISGAFKDGISAIRGGVTSMVSDISTLADMLAKQRAMVIGLSLDYVSAQIDVMSAAREARITQIEGAIASKKAVVSVAEAQAAFDAQRMADMNAALSLHEDLTLATDRWRWKVKSSLDESLDDMSNWSDETHALWAELEAARAQQRVAELQAQRDNLKAAWDQTKAVMDLADVSRNLQNAVQKLALMSGQAFGFNQLGATVGQRYSSLAQELAEIEANKSSIKTWANPANWFNGYYRNARRRQGQIRSEMRELESRDEFQGLGLNKRDIDKMIAGAGFMGLFGGSDQVQNYINNSALGDAARAIDKLNFESDLLDIKSEEKKLRADIDRGLAEMEYRQKSEPLESRIKAAELEAESQRSWAEYWRATNDDVRSSLADMATYQKDSAEQLRKLAETPVSLTLQIPAGKEAISVRELEEIEARLREQTNQLELRIDRVENPRVGASEVAGRVRG